MFYRTANGVIERPEEEIEREGLAPGFYLSRAFAPSHYPEPDTAAVFARVLHADNVQQLARAIRSIEIPGNWIFTDRHGSVAYQQSGTVPLRARHHVGFYPVPGWKSENRWQGRADPELLLSVVDPPSGVLSTANNVHTPTSGLRVQTLNFGSYRNLRAQELLRGSGRDLDLERFAQMQRDVYSIHADEWIKLLERLGVLRNDRELDRILLSWDRRYTVDSVAPDLFHRFISQALETLYTRLFGKDAWAYFPTIRPFRMLSAAVWERPLREWPESIRGILSPINRTQAEELSSIWEAVVASRPALRPWGELKKAEVRHAFYGGRLPKWFGGAET